MAYLSDELVNQWLASTKYTVQAVEPELENSVVDQMFARLAVRYATSGWADDGSTPELVVQALSMLYAAWFLQRQLSDDELDDQSYPIRLELRAWAVIEGILAETIDLPGIDPDPALLDDTSPLFFPTDESTQLAEDDPHDPEGSQRAFSMGMTF